MSKAINVKTHPNFTIDEIIEYTGWPVASPTQKENMRRVLDYFQQVVRLPSILREQDDSGPWSMRINGTKIRLLNWMQGIDFSAPVNPLRFINKGDPLIAYKDPSFRPGRIRGNWYTFPSTQQGEVDGKLAKPQIASKHACEVFADEAIRFLKDDHQGKPFFCYVAFDAPHDPHIVPDGFSVQYDPKMMPLPKNFLPQHPFDNGEMVVRDEQLLPWPRTPEQIRDMNAEYYRYISYLDTQIGRILDAVESSPDGKNTIVVYSADSGVARGSHGLIGKQNLYKHSVRVPLIIRGPGIAANRTTDAMCYLFDVLPTLGKFCGVEAPNTSEGIDFGEVLRDTDKSARPHLMFAYKNVQRAVRDERWKLIRYPQVDKTQLFDLKADPDEIRNLADKPEHAAQVGTLLALLEKERKLAGDDVSLTVANPKSGAWTPPKPRGTKPKDKS